MIWVFVWFNTTISITYFEPFENLIFCDKRSKTSVGYKGMHTKQIYVTSIMLQNRVYSGVGDRVYLVNSHFPAWQAYTRNVGRIAPKPLVQHDKRVNR